MSLLDRGTDAKVDRARTRASSGPARAVQIRRLLAGTSRRKIAVLSLLMLLVGVGVAVAGPAGSILDNDPKLGQGLAKAGPVNPSTQFPDWYRDKSGVTLEPCLEPKNPMCIIGDVPNPDAPVQLDANDPSRNNFPDEMFYFLADSNIGAVGSAGAVGKARLTLAVEGTASDATDPQVFARVRIRVTDGLVGNRDYKVIHPYGTTVVHTDADEPKIFVTEDVGLGVGNFNGVLSGRVGPFLRWTNDGSTADRLPAGYVGDPAVDHTVTGSPIPGHNQFRIEGPGVGAAAAPANRCTDLPESEQDDCVQTSLFSLMGKVATRSGVTVHTSTYSRGKDGDAVMDVLAEANNTSPVQNIVVQDVDAARRATPARQFPTTQMQTQDGNFLAHIDLPAGPAAPDAIPATAEVENASDVPVTRKKVTITDSVTGTATYDTASKVLHVEATSSDKWIDGGGPAAQLSLPFYGKDLVADTASADLVQSLDVQTGTPAANMVAPPATIRIESSRGGSVTIPVQIAGTAFTGLAGVRADAATDTTVRPGTTVILDGSASTGNVKTYAWSGPYAVRADGTLGDPVADSGIAITDADRAQARFTAPAADGRYGFRLTVTGDGTGADHLTDEVVVTVVTPATQPDALHPGTARYTAAQRRWVIDGTADVLANNAVTVHVGDSLAGPVVGTATVDRLGAWALDARDSDVVPDGTATVSLESTAGATLLGVPVDVRTAGGGAPAPAPAAAGALAAAAGAPIAASLPVVGTGTVGATALSAPAVIAARALGTGVPVTVAVPAGAGFLQLQVLTTTGKPLFSTVKKVKGGTKVRVRIRSAKLRRQVRSGKRYVIAVRTGPTTRRLGTAVKRTVRIR